MIRSAGAEVVIENWTNWTMLDLAGRCAVYVLGLFEGFFALDDGFVELDENSGALRILICRYRVGCHACGLKKQIREVRSRS